jgi:hypothetical protein
LIASGVLDRHDRFHRADHPEVSGADTQQRDCQEDRVCEAVTQEGWAVALARLIFMRHWE